MYTFYQQMKEEKQRLERQIESLERQLRNFPEGKLISSHTGKYCKWYISDGKKKTYIPKKNSNLIQKMAVKKYLTLRKSDLIREKKAVESYLKFQTLDIGEAEKLLLKFSYILYMVLFHQFI